MGCLPRRHGQRWTGKEYSDVWRMAKYGRSVEWIARLLQRTPRSIELALSRLELAHNPPKQLVINGRNYSHILRNASALVHRMVDLHASLPGVRS